MNTVVGQWNGHVISLKMASNYFKVIQYSFTSTLFYGIKFGTNYY